ncbi:MAG: PKD domain-containing protein [Deltaproteobacteria bacterium]|nr:PKD domain-containing protein [Deltaproteobacteria bacterium]
MKRFRGCSIIAVFAIAVICIFMSRSEVAAEGDHTYTGTAKIQYSELGELFGFEFPLGYEHIAWSNSMEGFPIVEGFSISYTVDDGDVELLDYHTWSAYDYRDDEGDFPGIVIVPDSYIERQNDDDWLIIDSTTRTIDEILDIHQTLVMKKSESRVELTMSVENMSPYPVSNIRIKRVCDLDLDVDRDDGTYGWANVADTWFELLENGVRCYTTVPPLGREAHSMSMYGIPTPTWFGADDLYTYYDGSIADLFQRDNYPEFAPGDYPVKYDYSITLSWDLAGQILEEGDTSSPVTVVYSMGIEETNKPNGETTDSAGVPKTEFTTLDNIYVRGSHFPANRDVNIYIVPDQGWAGGEAIPADVGDGMNTVMTDSEGNINVNLIWSSPLEAGEYDVVIDGYGGYGGMYDYETDAAIGDGFVGFTVTAPENVGPTANAGPDKTVTEGEQMTLDGSGSTDPDDGIASYLWEQIGGPPVTIDNADQAIAGFTAPQIGPIILPEQLFFRLTVTDFGGLSDDDICLFNVVNNLPPVADAGADQAIMENKKVTLDGSGSHDPDGVIVSYFWEQTKGPAVTIADPSAVTTTFITPGYEEGNYLLEFTLTVTDDGGLAGQDTCQVTVVENMPPEIPVQTGPADGELFGSGEPVTLTSSPYSDPEGNPHVETSWMIRRIDRPTYDYQHVSVTELEEYVATGLPSGLQYAWMVGYKDMGSKDNSWSVNEWTFTVGTFTVDTSVKVPTGWGINDYLMVSFTIWPEDPAATSAFGVAPDTTKIRIGTYDPTLGETGGYFEYGDPNLFVKPGTSYWFLVKGGFNAVIDGIPVSLDVDVDIPLLYNAGNANGWNMIAAPNNANYKWDDVEVLEYDTTGAIVQGPTRIDDLSYENTMIDKKLWRWESGTYASDTAEIEKHSGYWLKAKRANVWLRFPADVHLAAKGITEFYASLMMKEASKMAKAWGITPAYAATDTSDTPPMPMGGFTDTNTGSNSASSSKEGGSGGCFVGTTTRQ